MLPDVLASPTTLHAWRGPLKRRKTKRRESESSALSSSLQLLPLHFGAAQNREGDELLILADHAVHDFQIPAQPGGIRLRHQFQAFANRSHCQISCPRQPSVAPAGTQCI